jgi:drug/metabolite transporter (DMT)-like permease
VPHAYLILAVCALGLLGVLHKVADFRRCRAEAINLFLFLGAAVAMWTASVVTLGTTPVRALPPIAIGIGVVCGLLASTAILNFQRGVRYGKISTSWLIVNLSTALPSVLSIVMYHERLGARRTAGLGLAVVALLLLWLERRREEDAGQSSGAAKEVRA